MKLDERIKAYDCNSGDYQEFENILIDYYKDNQNVNINTMHDEYVYVYFANGGEVILPCDINSSVDIEYAIEVINARLKEYNL